ncbi:MAG TPA: protein kinase [Holophagaceae bacterium]|nr:protein kinase [Holophagaceae bacterium]
MEDPNETQEGLSQSGMETLAGEKAAKISPGPHRIVVKPRSTDPGFPVAEWERYAFVRFLGQGGMGRVYLARDRQLGREVAIKFVRLDDERYAGRFMAEARAQARVDHPHVCKVFEVGEVEGKVFIAMQHVKGLPLDVAALELTVEQKVMVLRDAALGVHEAHRVGIIHRDLKPSNILVERDADGSHHAYVMDFGLAHEWNTESNETGSVLGTPAFMSPEQARGEVSRLDRRADVYSLGATLYQVLTGKAAVSGSNPLEILSAVVSADVEPMRVHRLHIPRDLEAITLKCLEKDRARRYDSAKALAEDLDRFLAGDPVQARSTGVWYRIQRRLRKNKQVTAVGGGALVVVLVALGFTLKTWRDAGRRERLAQQFTESMAHIESMARYSALSPPHDIRPDLQAVRDQMARLRLEMKEAGSLANGPGNYALGRGYWTLDDTEHAREHLQMAWDAGYRAPRVAYALSLVLGQQYREKLLEAQRIVAPAQRQARLQEVDRSLRDPALGFLRRARGSDVPSPAYLEAQMAFFEGHLDEALDKLKALGTTQPWFFEAPQLQGSLLQARAWEKWNRGDREGAHADFEAGRAALGQASRVARSAPSVQVALGELEYNALFMEKFGQGNVGPVHARAMEAVRTALAAQPDHVPSLILQAALLGQRADLKTSKGEYAEDDAQAAVEASKQAVQTGPGRADARIALGKAYYQWGLARASKELDPDEPFTRGLEAFESLSPEKRDYTVWNHLGLIHYTWAEFQAQRDQDPHLHLNGAIAAFETATRMEPQLLAAWINLGSCLQQRADLPKASSPQADLQAALAALDQAKALNPKHWVPYFALGKVHYSLAMRTRDQGGDPKPALILSVGLNKQGLTINPSSPNLHNGTGIAASELARLAWEAGEDPTPHVEQSRAAFEQAIAVAPDQGIGYLNLADLLLWKAQYLGSEAALQEAGALLRKRMKAGPSGRDLLGNEGRRCALLVERAVREGRDPAAFIHAGETALAQALAQDPHYGDALLYLGQLRTAAAGWKVRHHQAGRATFEQALAPLDDLRALSPAHLEAALASIRLAVTKAAWERSTGQDPAESFALARQTLDGILKLRPRCAEALLLGGDLTLEEAEGLPPGAREAKAREARRALEAGIALNRYLAPLGNPRLARARHLEAGS